MGETVIFSEEEMPQSAGVRSPVRGRPAFNRFLPGRDRLGHSLYFFSDQRMGLASQATLPHRYLSFDVGAEGSFHQAGEAPP